MLDSLRRLWSAVEVRAEIPLPPEAVFDTIAEPSTYPEWLVGAQRIRAVDPDFPRAGSEFHHRVGAGPATVDDSSEVLVCERPERLKLRVHVGRLDGEVEFLVLPAPGGTEVRFRERPLGIPGMVTPLLRFTLHARNAESLRQLRNHLTDGNGAPRGAQRPAEAAT